MYVIYFAFVNAISVTTSSYLAEMFAKGWMKACKNIVMISCFTSFIVTVLMITLSLFLNELIVKQFAPEDL